MSDFERWSKWFACGRDLGLERTQALALMAWVAAHAANDGTGIELDSRSWSAVTEETGLTIDQARRALDALIAHGLMTAVGQETSGLLRVRAVI